MNIFSLLTHLICFTYWYTNEFKIFSSSKPEIFLLHRHKVWLRVGTTVTVRDYRIPIFYVMTSLAVYVCEL